MAYKKNDTTEKNVFQVTFPLCPNQEEHDFLDKYFNASLMTEHHLTSRVLKRLANMERTRAWRNNEAAISVLYEKLKSKAITKKQFNAEKKQLFEVKEDMIKKYGLNKDFIEADVATIKVYAGLVHSAVKQKLSYRVSKSVNDYLWGKGKEIRYTSWKNFKSIEAKQNTTGIRLVDGQLLVGKYSIKVNFNKKDKYGYEEQALTHNIHYCGIKRRWYPSGWKYFIYVCFGGNAPVKYNKDTGEVLHPLGKGRVGNDIGPQTLATVGDNDVKLTVLAEDVQTPYDEIRRIQRKMDRSRRMMNPEFFDQETGEVIPVNKLDKSHLTKRGKRKWKVSNNYKRLESRLRYLYMKIALQREQAHHELINQLVSFGDKFFIEEMNWKALAKRRKKDKVNEKGKHTSKNRFGRSIANKAPGKFVELYRRKVESLGGSFHEIDTRKAKASQYNHMDHTYKKKSLSKRWNDMPNGDRIQRDIYSAFLIQCTNRKLDGFTRSALKRKYEKFKAMHDQEIERLSFKVMPSSVGVKNAG